MLLNRRYHSLPVTVNSLSVQQSVSFKAGGGSNRIYYAFLDKPDWKMEHLLQGQTHSVRKDGCPKHSKDSDNRQKQSHSCQEETEIKLVNNGGEENEEKMDSLKDEDICDSLEKMSLTTPSIDQSSLSLTSYDTHEMKAHDGQSVDGQRELTNWNPQSASDNRTGYVSELEQNPSSSKEIGTDLKKRENNIGNVRMKNSAKKSEQAFTDQQSFEQQQNFLNVVDSLGRDFEMENMDLGTDGASDEEISTSSMGFSVTGIPEFLDQYSDGNSISNYEAEKHYNCEKHLSDQMNSLSEEIEQNMIEDVLRPKGFYNLLMKVITKLTACQFHKVKDALWKRQVGRQTDSLLLFFHQISLRHKSAESESCDSDTQEMKKKLQKDEDERVKVEDAHHVEKAIDELMEKNSADMLDDASDIEKAAGELVEKDEIVGFSDVDEAGEVLKATDDVPESSFEGGETRIENSAGDGLDMEYALDGAVERDLGKGCIISCHEEKIDRHGNSSANLDEGDCNGLQEVEVKPCRPETDFVVKEATEQSIGTEINEDEMRAEDSGDECSCHGDKMKEIGMDEIQECEDKTRAEDNEDECKTEEVKDFLKDDLSWKQSSDKDMEEEDDEDDHKKQEDKIKEFFKVNGKISSGCSSSKVNKRKLNEDFELENTNGDQSLMRKEGILKTGRENDCYDLHNIPATLKMDSGQIDKKTQDERTCQLVHGDPKILGRGRRNRLRRNRSTDGGNGRKGTQPHTSRVYQDPDDFPPIKNQKGLDLRTLSARCKSCMESCGQGGGNSSDSGQANNHSRRRSSNGSDNTGNSNQDEDAGSSDHPDGGDEGIDEQKDTSSIPTNSGVDAVIPGRDFKGVRKKHASMPSEAFMDLLGVLSFDSDTNVQLDPGIMSDVDLCLQILLHDLSPDCDPSCSVCLIIHSLLAHFASNQHAYRECVLCWQVFRLTMYHVQRCMQEGKKEKASSVDICHQMMISADFNLQAVQAQTERLWKKMLKYVVKILHPQGLNEEGTRGLFYEIDEEEKNSSRSNRGLFNENEQSESQSHSFSSSSTCSLGVSRLSSYTSSSATSVSGQFVRQGSGRRYQSSLKSIPEKPSPVGRPVFRGGRGRRLSRQNSSGSTSSGGFGPGEEYGTKADDLSEGTVGSSKQTESNLAVAELVYAETFSSMPNTAPSVSSNRSSFGNNDDASLLSSASGQTEEAEGAVGGQSMEEVIYSRFKMVSSGNVVLSTQSPYETQKVYGPVGVMSMPIDVRIPPERDQLLSLETSPTGEPGIGEVVYGTRRQIMKVAKYWGNVQRGVEEHMDYKYQVREEGVILATARKNLKILRTRYQKKNQWMRLSHLGNGVSGKCHLAMDTTTQFKFCVKRIHIAKYEESELVIWSDLDHTNIVKLYGAIRHGLKIYIFCEFVDGGSLTSLINEQRNLNRRLSHWMCLRYFKQLLSVLVYLKSQHVLHEDLKADNILVKRNTTLIAVTDFGLSRRMNVDCEMRGVPPVGSQTQWSPEKAASEGHGFPADVWASVCILVHMLSGHPPWMVRFQGTPMLHFVIFMQSPPLADVPANIQPIMRDLITLGFTVDAKLRPAAHQLLHHSAFKMLDQGAPDSYWSTLLSSGQPIPNNQLDNGTKELEDILTSLAGTGQSLGGHSRDGQLSFRSGENREAIFGTPAGEVRMVSVRDAQDSGVQQPQDTSRQQGGNQIESQATGGEASEEPSGSLVKNVNSPSNGMGQVLPEYTVSPSWQDATSADPHGTHMMTAEETSFSDHQDEHPLVTEDPASGTTNCSGYVTSPESLVDPDECIERFLNDDFEITQLPVFDDLTSSGNLDPYEPTNIPKKYTGPAPRDLGGFNNIPDFSQLMQSMTFSGIVWGENQDYVGQPSLENTPENSPVAEKINTSDTRDVGRQQESETVVSSVSRAPEDANRPYMSQQALREQVHGPPASLPPIGHHVGSSQKHEHLSLLNGRPSGHVTFKPEPEISSRMEDLEGSASPLSSPNFEGHVSPTSMKPLVSSGMEENVAGNRGNSPPDDPYPTSYYPTSLLYYLPEQDEHIASGDLFGHGSQPELAKPVQDAPKAQEVKEYNSSMETLHDPSELVFPSPSSSGSDKNFDAEAGTDARFKDHRNKARSSSCAANFGRGIPDHGVETPKDMESASLVVAEKDEINHGGTSNNANVSENQAAEGGRIGRQNLSRSPEKAGLYLNVSASPPKHPKYSRVQSVPAKKSEPKLEVVPKSCPEIRDHQSMAGAGKAAAVAIQGSSGRGTGSGVCYSSSPPHQRTARSSDSSGLGMPDSRGRTSSIENSPSTPKSLYEQQTKEFLDLEKASQSTLSMSEHAEMMEGSEARSQDVHFEIGASEDDLIAGELASLQQTLPPVDQDIGYLIQLHEEESGEFMKKIRVSPKYDEWRDVIEIVRSAVLSSKGYKHFVLKHPDGQIVDYNAPMEQANHDVIVSPVDEEGRGGCWCEIHEDNLRVMA